MASVIRWIWCLSCRSYRQGFVSPAIVQYRMSSNRMPQLNAHIARVNRRQARDARRYWVPVVILRVQEITEPDATRPGLVHQIALVTVRGAIPKFTDWEVTITERPAMHEYECPACGRILGDAA